MIDEMAVASNTICSCVVCVFFGQHLTAQQQSVPPSVQIFQRQNTEGIHKGFKEYTKALNVIIHTSFPP